MRGLEFFPLLYMISFTSYILNSLRFRYAFVTLNSKEEAQAATRVRMF